MIEIYILLHSTQTRGVLSITTFPFLYLLLLPSILDVVTGVLEHLPYFDMCIASGVERSLKELYNEWPLSLNKKISPLSDQKQHAVPFKHSFI